MPSAAPVPRGPSALLLGAAAELLTGTGCPVCRYADAANDRYLAWFALEGHADAVLLTRLCASRGMCPPHTRRLLRQPGAAVRLTAVYRYVVEAAIRDPAARPARCPGCEHDAGAAGRALEVLLDDLAVPGVRQRYLELGGLCVPHLRAAAATRPGRAHLGWLASVLLARISASPPGLDVLTGAAADAADERAAVRARRAGPPDEEPPRRCPACQAAALAERSQLAWAATGAGRDGEPRAQLCLCAGHLRDAAGTAECPSALLDWQARCQAASLTPLAADQGRARGWLTGRPRRLAAPGCLVCADRDLAGQRELERYRLALRSPGAQQQQRAVLCVRHVSRLYAADATAGQRAALALADPAARLINELSEAFRKDTWPHRHEPRGREANAWRRAAVFLDGAV